MAEPTILGMENGRDKDPPLKKTHLELVISNDQKPLVTGAAENRREQPTAGMSSCLFNQGSNSARLPLPSFSQYSTSIPEILGRQAG
jgi:hypothetical protein